MQLGGRLGPYEVLEPLGSGGMGAVYKARDTRLGRLVAIKILRQDQAPDVERDRRLLQKARAASSLSPQHCHRARCGYRNGVVYMVMELVDGKPLDRIIPSQGMRLTELLRIATPIADAFARAHAAGIVHGDLKPSNVMLTASGAVKVLDFGLAELAHEAPATVDETLTATNPVHTLQGTVMGTPGYMSPEQAEGKPTDARSDIFSFGVLLYEMATGRRAFSATTNAATMVAVIAREPEPVMALRPDLPADFLRLLTRYLRKSPERRPQSMSDVRVLLEDLVAEPEAVPPAVSPASAESGWRIKSIAAAVAAALVLLSGALLWRARSGLPAAPSTDIP